MEVEKAIENNGILESPSLKRLLLLPFFRLQYLYEQTVHISSLLPQSSERLVLKIALDNIRGVLRSLPSSSSPSSYRGRFKGFQTLFTELKGKEDSLERTKAIMNHLRTILNNPLHPLSFGMRYRIIRLAQQIRSIIAKGTEREDEGQKERASGNGGGSGAEREPSELLTNEELKRAIFEEIVSCGQRLLTPLSTYFRKKKEYKKNLIAAVTELTISSLYGLLYEQFKRSYANEDIILRKKLNEFVTATTAHFSIRKKYYSNVCGVTIDSFPPLSIH
jgi:hypothetical protein